MTVPLIVKTRLLLEVVQSAVSIDLDSESLPILQPALPHWLLA